MKFFTIFLSFIAFGSTQIVKLSNLNLQKDINTISSMN